MLLLKGNLVVILSCANNLISLIVTTTGIVIMTQCNVTNRRFSIKSFLSRIRKKKLYITMLETAYARQSIELQTLKRLVNQG